MGLFTAERRVEDELQPPARSMETTQVMEWSDGAVVALQDALAAEEPLEIRVNGSPLTVTMRTPGNDVELAAGFLLGEGIVESREQLAHIGVEHSGSAARGNRVEVELRDCEFNPESLQQNFPSTSSCGICGRASIESVRHRRTQLPDRGFRVDPEVLSRLPDALRAQQAVFKQTGGLHAAALFAAQGNLLAVREDIGRHNAVDKVIGWALLEGCAPLREHILMVSGRGGFEIVQKALVAGIPVLACVSAPSSLAVRLARELGGTLIGFVRGRRFVVYSGEFRCLPDAS